MSSLHLRKFCTPRLVSNNCTGYLAHVLHFISFGTRFEYWYFCSSCVRHVISPPLSAIISLSLFVLFFNGLQNSFHNLKRLAMEDIRPSERYAHLLGYFVPAAASNVTFEQYADNVLEHKLAAGILKHSTYNRYKSMSGRIYPAIGNLKLKDITP